MIWQFITMKKCQRHLQLIELLKKERYTVAELAKQTKVSRRTILRYLDELQRKKYVTKDNYWRIDWRYETSYLELCRKILFEDPHFQLFRRYLWDLGPEKINYTKLRQLNRQLICLNLSANRRTGSLRGEPTIIFLLQLRYLRDFYYFDEQELYQQLDEYYAERAAFPVTENLFPDQEMVTAFTNEFGLQTEFVEFFYSDYIRYHFRARSDLYHSHQKHQTIIYQEIQQVISIIEETRSWEIHLMKKIATVQLFELFFGIHQGLPVTFFNLKWKQVAIPPHFYFLGKELKRRLPVLSNCRVDDLAVALKNILHVSYKTALSLNPNLKTSLVIQEGYQAYFSSHEGI
ncbi:HTH domain-containing protein [Enterococcus malodoratus]|uniref:HTH domain-containing protein n=1 Tax=Enterococcus malodoratus TaxID=71451 RepID=UPI0039AF8682